MYFPDERREPEYAQIISHVVSNDGSVTWSAYPDGSTNGATNVAPGLVVDVQSDVDADRPGMPTVATLPDGRMVMAYEICAPAPFRPVADPDQNCSTSYSPHLLLDTTGTTVRFTTATATGPTGCMAATAVANSGVLPYADAFAEGVSGWVDYGGCCHGDVVRDAQPRFEQGPLGPDRQQVAEAADRVRPPAGRQGGESAHRQQAVVPVELLDGGREPGVVRHPGLVQGELEALQALPTGRRRRWSTPMAAIRVRPRPARYAVASRAQRPRTAG
ncbi:hypothetical protein SHXM_09359 [Streptomyces hygroscopicus]|nr:hypothetical protein SHXM_09359 [Streptomyces hygroscopicus]